MDKPYSRELSADTLLIIIPSIAVPAFVISLTLAALNGISGSSWYYWVVTILSPIAAYAALLLVRKDHLETAVNLFVGANLLFITLILSQDWQPGSPFPYLYTIFIVIMSMTRAPFLGFWVWFEATILMVIGVGFSLETFDFRYIFQLLPPIFISFLLALYAYLSSFEWRFAVESVSELHRKVQRRRDDLFHAQETLQQINHHLQFLNDELDKARQAALNERDLRTRFMSNVSHELRTPLNSIVNFAHIIKKGAHGPINKLQGDYLNRIETSGWHLLNVLNDLLDMAQIEAGEFKLHQEPTNLHSICEEAMMTTRGLLLDKPVELRRDYPQQWPMVYVDRIRLKQALLNLLGNAVKYTEKGHICLQVTRNGEWVQMNIEDTGIGIAPEHYEAIFQEFRQVDENVARRRVGTGLGLPIARHLIERHGGTINVRSQLNQGSTFSINLPIYTPDQLAQ